MTWYVPNIVNRMLCMFHLAKKFGCLVNLQPCFAKLVPIHPMNRVLHFCSSPEVANQASNLVTNVQLNENAAHECSRLMITPLQASDSNFSFQSFNLHVFWIFVQKY